MNQIKTFDERYRIREELCGIESSSNAVILVAVCGTFRCTQNVYRPRSSS
jgi:hypothetical protein